MKEVRERERGNISDHSESGCVLEAHGHPDKDRDAEDSEDTQNKSMFAVLTVHMSPGNS